MLRHLLIPVIYNPQFLLHKKLDEALIREAHRALLRQQSGITDSFLFILCTEITVTEVTEAISRYGFPDVSVTCIDTKDEEGEERDDDDINEEICFVISGWLDEHHPGAITSLFHPEYDSLDLWWSGVEATSCDWNFLEGFKETLPHCHTKRAETWLKILSESIGEDYTCWAYEAQFTLYAAALCEWLHGFEAASGNSYNGFDAEYVCNKLNMDDFFLGYLLGQIEPTASLDEMLHNAMTDDLSGIKAYALKQAVERERVTIRNALAGYFGGDTALFWALYSSIWPSYKDPINDACCKVVGLEEVKFSEVAPGWIFVTDGWTESADMD